MSPRSCCILLFTLQKACYTRSVCLSPRSCCILLFTLQKACYTRSVCLSPRSCSISWHSFSPWHNLSKLSSAHGLPKELFIVVNVVFVVFHPQQAIRERARWQGSFRSCGEFPLVGAVGGWPVAKPWGFALPLRRAGGRVSDWCRRGCKSRGYKQTFCCSLGREACRPAPWISRPACRRPGLRRYPGLRRPWWPS